MSKKHDFDVVAKMVSNGTGISLFPDMLNLNGLKKGGGKITFGIPDPAFQEIIHDVGVAKGRYNVMVICIDMDEFNKVKDTVNDNAS